MPSSRMTGGAGRISGLHSANGVFTDVAREMRSLGRIVFWPPVIALVLVVVLGVGVAYQVPLQHKVDVGSRSDQAYVRNFHERLDEGGRTFRWSDIYGYVTLKGTGGERPFTVSLDIDTERQARTTIIINGETFIDEELGPGWRTLEIHVDERHRTAFASRDLVVEVRAPGYATEDAPQQSKGLKVDSLRFRQDAAGQASPSFLGLLLSAVTVVLVYAVVCFALVGWVGDDRARPAGLLVGLITGALLVMGHALVRPDVAVALGHFVVTLGTMLLAIVIASVAAPGAAPDRRRVVSLVGVLTAVAFGLRFGGMGLAQAVIIDMPWHMKWLNTLLSGNWQALYFPGGLSSVPREWGLELLIPKSPLFYLVVAPLGWLTFDLETSVKWLICLLDACLVPLVAWFCLRAGGSVTAAAFAAGLYAITPLAFRAFAYGILPTMLAQVLAALVFAAATIFQSRYGRLGWVVQVGLLSLALLSFPTVALFITLVLGGLGLFLWRYGPERSRLGAAQLRRLSALLAVAWGIALISYYGLYIGPMAASATALLAPSSAGSALVRWAGGIPEMVAWTADYVVTPLPYLLAALGLAFLWRSQQQSKTAYVNVALLALWAGVAPVFFFVNYRVDMIGKHLFFVMVPVAVAGGVACAAAARRGTWGRALAGLAVATVFWQALLFWADRLVRQST